MLISDIIYEQDNEVTQAQLDALENILDRVFSQLGIDVEFTRHFLDRVNDERNRRQITIKELGLLFKKEFIKHGKIIARLGPDTEAVMKDMETDINLPFALRWDANNNELDLIAKTVMRKQDFKTSNKTFTVEGYKLQLERDADMMVLHITDTATGKRTEVRGKAGYETSGYDPEDKLHQLLDKIGRSASVSDMMNGDVVTINPNHPTGASAKAAATTAFNESLDNPYPFKFTGPNDAQEFSAVAQTPNGTLRMDFETTDYDNFGIDFVVGKSMGKTDAGDEFRVFATVVAMMKKWINTVGIEHVESFDFGANKDEHASDGRARLYTRFAKQLASQLGWKLEQSTTQDRSTTFFKLTNPKPVPREQEYWDALEERINEAAGRVVKGVNTTPDVGVNQTSIEAKKFGNTVDKDGKPPLLNKKYAKNTTPSNTYNLGLSENYTPMQIAIIEGGHCLEDLIPEKNYASGLFNSLMEVKMDNFDEFDEDFTGKPKKGSQPGSLKRKAAQYLGKGAGDNISKSDLRRLQAKANKMKKSSTKAERQRGIQLAKQVSWANNFGVADKKKK